ncbi:MAG: putative carboxyl-terminal protease [Candidatus Saccharibacteria bacterium]|nr:putative carboxyl-terminal protease [Candidatus Saccharibacteria bacterium]
MSTPEKQTEKKWVFTPSVFVLTAALVFIVGYAAGTRNDQIVGIVAPAFGIKVDTSTLDLSSVQNTYHLLKQNFDGNLDTAALIAGASQGLVAASGDVHTEYFNADEAKQFQSDLTGDIGGGVGAEIGVRDNVPTVISVLADTPAQKAGVKAGDILQQVNDQPLTKLTVDEVVQKIRGDIGTTVKLTITRDGQVMYFNITRAEITSPSVSSKVNGDVGILTITRFDEQTGDQARSEANKLKSVGVKKIILDLRDNGGGYLSAAPQVAGLWLNNMLVATEKRDGKEQDRQTTGTDTVLAGMPTVVLVNAGTASAAEIVSAALKDQGNNITFVGERTYGKGTVQTTIPLNGGALLKVTVQRWYTPKDVNIDGKGLTPDKVVGLTNADILAGHDPQIDAAMKQLDS